MPGPAADAPKVDVGPIARLIEVMAQLRTPGSGCPWDLDQTFDTIAPYTIEEAYEVADAITQRNMRSLREELGDLLLQVVYHARLAEEQEAFKFSDVVEAITQKMVRRHPHVFGDAQARAAGAAKGFWEEIKAKERAEKDGADQVASLLDAVPRALPALTRAVKLQSKAARVGFDWLSLKPVLAKMREELGELEQSIAAADRAGIQEEYGDLLFVLANVARHLDIDPEDSLRGANLKFVRRFRRIEEKLTARGRSPAQSDLAEMDALWDEAKAEERSGA